MADYKILCPACAAMLSSKKPISNGKKITCPNCHKPFVAATSAANSSDSGSLEFELSPVAAAVLSKSATKSAKSDPAGRQHNAGKSKGPPKPSSKRLLLVSLVFLLVLLAAAGGALGVYYAMKPDAPVAQPKTKDKKADKADAKPTQVAQNKSKAAAPTAALTGAPTNAKEEKSSKNLRPVSVKLDAKPAEAAGGSVEAEKTEAKVKQVAAKVVKRIADWKEFKSSTGGYTVQFPSPPDEMKERDEDIIFYETKADWNDTNYEITFYRLKKDELNVPVKDRFNSLAEPFKATIKDRKEITLSGQPALELMLVDDKTRSFSRWTVYKGHVFHIAVSGNKDTLGPDQVTRFLDSFQFTGDPQGEFLDLGKATTIPEKKK